MIKRLKRKLSMSIRTNKYLYKFQGLFVLLNLYLFNYNLREHKARLGDLHKDKIFYVIRSSGTEEGLLSLYSRTINEIYWARHKGYIPVVDFENYPTQYSMDCIINNTYNAWEYFFEQPEDIPLNEVYESYNVILSGWRTVFNKKDLQRPELIADNVPTEDEVSKCYEFIRVNGAVQRYILDIINDMKSQLFSNNNVLGIFLRGTDYTKLKPKGHYKQPHVNEVIEVVKKFIETYDVDKLFLATEDMEIYSRINAEFGDLLIEYGEDYIDNYDGKTYIHTSHFGDKTKYQVALDYLVKMLMLAECNYLISSLAGGSRYAIINNNNRYKHKYIFDQGKY